MSRNIRYALGATVALVLVGATYTMSGSSRAYSSGNPAVTTQSDVFAIMVAAKGLPVERFDAI